MPVNFRPQLMNRVWRGRLDIDLGRQSAWRPVGSTEWVGYGLVAAGWILATTVVAGVGRSLKRA